MSEQPNTYLDELVDFKSQVIAKLANDQSVVALLLNDPDVDMESDDAYEVVEKHIFDYDYIDGTIERNDAYLMVDAELLRPSSGSMNKYALYVQAVCSKGFNRLPPTFKGMKGNRTDNLMRHIDRLLNGSREFGVGKLELFSARSAMVPDAFTSKMLTYDITDFRRERF